MTIKVDVQKIFHYILLYMLVSIGLSNFSVAFYPYSEYLVFLASGVVLLKRKEKISLSSYILFAITFISVIYVRLAEGGLGIVYLSTVLSTLLIAHAAYLYDPIYFTARFIRLVSVLAIVSIICFIVGLFAPQVLDMILLYKQEGMSTGSINSGILFYTMRSDDIRRNSGIYTEPGLYQCVLNIAIYYLIFMENNIGVSKKTKKKMLIVLIVALVTTKSTTGYLCFLFLLCGVVFSSNIKHKNYIYVIIVAGILYLAGGYYIQGDNSVLYTALIGKIISKSGKIDLNADTGQYRINTIRNCWELIKMNPFGVGNDNFESYTLANGTLTAGAGLLYSMAVSGVIPILYTLGWIFLGVRKGNSINKIGAYVYLGIFLVTTLSEMLYIAPLFAVAMVRPIHVAPADEYKLNRKNIVAFLYSNQYD